MKSYLTTARLKPPGFLILLLTTFASCTSTTVDEFRQGETGIESDESVVVLGRRQASDYETRSEFVECVGERMTRGDGAIRIVPERQFIDAMFPWFEPRTAPLRTRDLELLMAEDVIARKMDEFGIRYIVWLDGVTETSDRAGSLSCAIAPGGGACFGVLYIRKLPECVVVVDSYGDWNLVDIRSWETTFNDHITDTAAGQRQCHELECHAEIHVSINYH